MSRTRLAACMCAFMLLACGTVFAADCNNDMAAFLHHPQKAQYQGIAGRKECWEIMDAEAPENQATKDRLYNAMTHLAGQGNPYAVNFLVEMSPGTGIYAEDLNAMLGFLIDTHPELVLTLLAEKKIPQSMFYDVVRATGEEFVDNAARENKELKKRLRAVKTVHDPALKEEKNLAIDYLSDANLPTRYLPETLVCPVKPCK